MKKVLIEFVVVGVCGALLGLAANAVSPRGLRLSRNYFPAIVPPTTNAPAPLGNTTNTNAAVATNTLAQRLAMLGFGLMDSNSAVEAFNSTERLQNQLIFIDARDDSHYQAGHIPGAYQLDYYRPENYLSVVLPAAMIAEKIVLYCNGGSCEDSEFAAILLRDAGVPPEKLNIYAGGFTEWSSNSFSVEIGAKDSQQFRQK